MINLKVKIKNFKSIGSTELNLKSGLNILIGPNGSGKTCLLSSLKFIRDLFVFGAAQALARNGGARRVYRRNSRTISFSLTYDYGERIFQRRRWPCQLSWEIVMSQSGPEGIAVIIRERVNIIADINGRKRTLFRYRVDRSNVSRTRTGIHLVKPNEFGRDLFSIWDERFADDTKQKLYEDFTNKLLRNVVKQTRENTDMSIFPLVARIDRKIQELYSLFVLLNEYSILPDIARQSTEQLRYAQMQPNGAGVSEVIHALERKRFDRIQAGLYYGREEYLSYEPYMFSSFRHRYFRYPWSILAKGFGIERNIENIEGVLEKINRELSAAVQPIESVTVETDPTNGRRFVVFRAGKEKFNPEEVSDGTIKWLCILVSILVPHSPVYLLEEPENFLHPWMQQRLIDMMRQHAEQNDTVFILSSHSSTVLNSTVPAEVLVVNSTTEGTEISQIKNREEIEQALKRSQFRLGDFWVSGALEGVP